MLGVGRMPKDISLKSSRRPNEKHRHILHCLHVNGDCLGCLLYRPRCLAYRFGDAVIWIPFRLLIQLVMKNSLKYIFIIDTKEYAGNFERDLTAWITGQVGDCNVGDWIANRVDPATHAFFQNRLEYRHDEHGCRRPTTIWESPNSKKFNSVAIFLEPGPSNKAKPPSKAMIKEMIKRAKSFNKAGQEFGIYPWETSPITITGFRLIVEQVTYEATNFYRP
jgi:hypothetical protein